MSTDMAVVQLILIVAAFLSCGYLILCVKAELQRARKRAQEDLATLRGKVEELEGKVAELSREVGALPVPPEPVPISGISRNKRTQAMRMMRLGETPGEIAATLGLPRKEVELLMKVQRLLLDPGPGIAAGFESTS